MICGHESDIDGNPSFEYDDDDTIDIDLQRIQPLEDIENDRCPNSPPPPPFPEKSKEKSAKTTKKKETFLWKDDLVHFIINKWQGAVLYNIKDPAYHDKNKRNNALERIFDSISFMEFFPVPTKEQIP